MTMVSAERMINRVIRHGLAVRKPVPIDEWADRNRVIPDGNPEPGSWRTSRTPYMREPMLAAEDPGVSELTLMMGSQLGKTELDLNVLFKSASESSDQWLLVFPNDKLAKAVLKNRVRKSLRVMPILKGIFRQKRLESGAAELNFTTGCSITTVGSGSSTNVRSRPIRKIIIDEFELCVKENSGVMQEARQRTGAFASRTLIIKTGTPGIKGEGLDAEYEQSDMRRYEVPCPHCRRYQQLVFRQVRWDGGLAARGDDVERDAFYECEHCNAAIYNHHKPAMLAQGVWLKKGQLMAQQEDGSSVIVGNVAPSSRVGFQLSSLYSPFKTFGWVARDFVEAKGFPGPEWVNGKLGEAWSLKGDTLELEDLRKMCVPAAAGGYRLGRVPDDVLMLTMAVDVQADHCWAVVEGWTKFGIDCYLIAAERIPSPVGSGLWQLDRLRTSVFPRANGSGSLPIMVGFIDCGFRTDEVYRYCLDRKGKFFYPVQGQDHLSLPQYAKKLEKMPDGKPMKGGLDLLHVNNSHWSGAIWGQIQNSFRAVSGKTDELPPDVMRPPGRRFFPEDCPEFVLVQMTSEAAITKRKGGKTIVTYEKRPGRRDNHVLDCFRYGAAGADWAGVKNLIAQAGTQQRYLQGSKIAGANAPSIDRARGRWSKG